MEEEIKTEKEIRTYGDLARIARRMQTVIKINVDKVFDLDIINKVITNIRNSYYNKLIEKFGIDKIKYSLDIINEIEYQADQLLKICNNLETKDNLLKIKFKIDKLNEIKSELDKEIEH